MEGGMRPILYPDLGIETPDSIVLIIGTYYLAMSSACRDDKRAVSAGKTRYKHIR